MMFLLIQIPRIWRYVCVDDEGFETYNITNPSNIQYINDIIYGGYMTHSYVVGNIAYVCGVA